MCGVRWLCVVVNSAYTIIFNLATSKSHEVLPRMRIHTQHMSHYHRIYHQQVGPRTVKYVRNAHVRSDHCHHMPFVLLTFAFIFCSQNYEKVACSRLTAFYNVIHYCNVCLHLFLPVQHHFYYKWLWFGLL